MHAVRGQPGQIAAAKIYRELVAGSAIRASHLVGDERVQDPYSLRCQPQVMGAVMDLIAQAGRTLLIEANAVTDNPLVFPDADAPGGGIVVSGGNFHAEPVAFAADTLALAIAEIGALAERRIALLIDATLSGLPPFLVREPGVNSGFMIAHVTAAALASENKSLAHPASVDSLPTSANQEDHVSMATFAARRLDQMAHNTGVIVGIELLAAAQGIEFHRPLTSSAHLEHVHAQLRARVAAFDEDRFFAPDIEAARADGDGGRAVGRLQGPVRRAASLNRPATGVAMDFRFKAGSAAAAGVDAARRHRHPRRDRGHAWRPARWRGPTPTGTWPSCTPSPSEMGASTLSARWSRYVIDLNRPPEDTNLYPGPGHHRPVPGRHLRPRAPVPATAWSPDAAEVAAPPGSATGGPTTSSCARSWTACWRCTAGWCCGMRTRSRRACRASSRAACPT